MENSIQKSKIKILLKKIVFLCFQKGSKTNVSPIRNRPTKTQKKSLYL